MYNLLENNILLEKNVALKHYLKQVFTLCTMILCKSAMTLSQVQTDEGDDCKHFK